MKLPDELFLQMVANMPLISIDFIIHDEQKRILLGLRANEPAKGTWYFPGGRIFKNETIKKACGRIARDEVNLPYGKHTATMIGVNEWFFDTNFMGVEGVSTHYLALAFEMSVAADEIDERAFDRQHRALAWMTLEEIRKNPEVHKDVVHVLDELEKKRTPPKAV